VGPLNGLLLLFLYVIMNNFHLTIKQTSQVHATYLRQPVCPLLYY